MTILTTLAIIFLATACLGEELDRHRTNTHLVEGWPPPSTIDPYKPNITIGFLSSYLNMGLGKLIAGAIPLAVDKVNEDPELLPNHNLRFIAYDAGEPNTAVSIKKMTQMKEEGVVAFIGPEHSCMSEALVAAAWNMPMITYKCSDRIVSDKSVFPTFARTLPPSSKVSRSLISLLRHFQWNRVVLLVAANPWDEQVAEALTALARVNGIHITDRFNLPGDYLTKFNNTLKSIILGSFKKTRVYVIMAEMYAVVDIARFMQEIGLQDTGEYVIIAFEEDEVYNPNKEFQYIRREFEAAYGDTVDPSPFKSLLLLSPCPPINPDYALFQNLVLNYSSLDPFNIPFHPVIKVEVPIHAGLAYDAVMIYASALTKALADNKSITDGAALLEYIRSRLYDSILGFSVMIDKNGDAEGNFTVMALLDSDEEDNQKRMQPVASFTHQGLADLPVG